MWSTVNIRLSLSTPYQQQTPHETPNGIAIDQAPSYTETVAPEHIRHEISTGFGIDPKDMLKAPCTRESKQQLLESIFTFTVTLTKTG